MGNPNDTFLDVRKAFRLLSVYQSSGRDIANYIRERFQYDGMWGKKWFTEQVNTTKDSKYESADYYYADLNVSYEQKPDWGWMCLYGYLFEYYFGKKAGVEMSVIQVSDSGFTNVDDNHSRADISSFTPVEQSESYFILNAGRGIWLPGRSKSEDNAKTFMKFMASKDMELVVEKDSECSWAIAMKFPMERFTSQASTDEVIREFQKRVHEISGDSIPFAPNGRSNGNPN